MAQVKALKEGNSSTKKSAFARSATAQHIGIRAKCAGLVLRQEFDWVVCVAIILNAASLGVQTNFMANSSSPEVPIEFLRLETFFCVVFALELCLRLFTFKKLFFTMPGFHWNVFDFIVVILQVTEEVLAAFQSDADLNFSFARVVRLMRLVRVIRIARILRLIHELRVLVVSIGNSMRSLMWTVVLLWLLIYSVALVLTQLVTEHQHSSTGDSADPELERWWGDMPRSMLSLFESIVGGVDWEQILSPLTESITPGWPLALLFVVYIMFTSMAMMNVVTGIFVDSVLTSAKNDQNTILLSNAKEIFNQLHGSSMSRDEFVKNVREPQMQRFMRGIDVDPSDAEHLFSLLDVEESGLINSEEFLTASVRLREPAKGLDTAMLLREVRKMAVRMKDLEDITDHMGVSSEQMLRLERDNGDEGLERHSGEGEILLSPTAASVN